MNRAGRSAVKFWMLLGFGCIVLGIFSGALSQANATLGGVGAVMVALMVNILADLVKEHLENMRNKNYKKKGKRGKNPKGK